MGETPVKIHFFSIEDRESLGFAVNLNVYKMVCREAVLFDREVLS